MSIMLLKDLESIKYKYNNFEHHYDLMIKEYKYSDINRYLINKGFYLNINLKCRLGKHLNIFIQNKNNVFRIYLLYFLLAFIIRLTFIYLLNPASEKLIEDELLYWKAALLYLEKGYLERSVVAERMLGVFIYAKTLLILSFKNLKIYLVLQSLLDALTCIIIYKVGSIILPKQKMFIFLSAAFSPLMVILSSQVLSETIFLFLFTTFLYFSINIILYQRRIFFNIAMAGLFLGFSTCIKTITYPLVFCVYYLL